MAVLQFGEDELLSSHPFARPHRIGDQLCHGGFDAEDRYVPPRALGRARALAAWGEALASRGGAPLAADSSLLAGVRYPTPEQQRLLLLAGLGQTFWNALTITGKIEARGRVLAHLTFPDFQEVVVDDVSGMAIGHLNRGLLRAHGLDEGGEPERGIGGHDVMWFALRDLAFGPDAYPDVEPPERIGRAEDGARRLPELPPMFEGALAMLLNLLIIEFRAEIGFAFTEAVLLDRELFRERRPQAEEAARVVQRIRQDEVIHIESLRLYLGELRSATFRTEGGGTVPGRVLIDRVWADMVRWATVEQPPLVAAQQKEIITRRIREHGSAQLLEEFLALGPL
jgi:hypothetical protein